MSWVNLQSHGGVANKKRLIKFYDMATDSFLFLSLSLFPPPPPPPALCVLLPQQAWPSGTQQILLPPAWQQLTHTSVQHATVIPDSMSGTQPLANWR